MSELTTQLLKRLERRLTERQTEPWREVDREVHASTGEMNSGVSAPDDTAIVDDGIVDAPIDLNLASIERQIHELRLINVARERLRDGTFGICARCGEPVGLAHLLAVPYAEFCVDCQRQARRPVNLHQGNRHEFT
jgi:DnaK suppressor protein